MNKYMTTAVFAAAAISAATLCADTWRGLSDENYYSGPKLTEADLAGKVVLVDAWGVNCPPCRALLPTMEQLWQSYKSKPFVLVGSHCQGRQPERVAELVKANKLTYPIYERFGIAEGEPSFSGIPFLYVVNHRGKVVYSGRDHDALMSAIDTALQAVGGTPVLFGGVQLQSFKAMGKQLVLGKSIKNPVKTLQNAVKKGEAKNATAVQQKQAEEAKSILAAIDEAKGDIKEEIEARRTTDPEAAYKLAKAFVVTFPEEGASYKSELADMAAKAKDAAKNAKAK